MEDEEDEGDVSVLIVGKSTQKVLEVLRYSRRIMKLKLMAGGKLMNVVSAYAPQVHEGEKERIQFWEEFEDVVQKVDVFEKLILGGD